ncbi:hypothetical protein PHET_05339 [Paragonimus heterotremus]|uniref:Uncharacterized protein n=1 Tax=Paragonimus heterotremus TaxID=100268 RepID=A0A8J4WHX7_9TREM|nr:hypothetical protein PHET_05339 [Paragonimus heterotremus]
MNRWYTVLIVCLSLSELVFTKENSETVASKTIAVVTLNGSAVLWGKPIPWKQEYKNKSSPAFKALQKDICNTTGNAIKYNVSFRSAYINCSMIEVKPNPVSIRSVVTMDEEWLKRYHVPSTNPKFPMWINNTLTTYFKKYPAPSQAHYSNLSAINGE